MKQKGEFEWYWSTEPPGDRESPVSTKQLSTYMGVTTRTIAAYREKGLIPFWKVNARLIRYELSAVEAALGKPNE
jgi:hypothetical protein